MIKRLLFIVVLCLSLIALFGPDATARCRVIGGVLRCTDLCISTELLGVGNPDINYTNLCTAIGITQASGLTYNPPCNADTAQGVVFYPDLTLISATNVTPLDLTEVRGRALVEGQCWAWGDENPTYLPGECNPNYTPDDSIIGYLTTYVLQKVAPNPLWNFVFEKVDTLYAWRSVYEVKQGELVRSDATCVECKYDPDGNICDDFNPMTCNNVADRICEAKGLGDVCDSASSDCYENPDSCDTN